MLNNSAVVESIDHNENGGGYTLNALRSEIV